MKRIKVKDIEVSYKKVNQSDFISLTDMAKFRNPDHTGLVIANWLRANYTLEFMGIWEKMNNPNFNVLKFEYIRNESRSQSFSISVSQWIEQTNAIGIVTSAGRYGGTYASKDIAFEFATWISAEFKYWIIAEFQRLKTREQEQLEWDAKRELAKINYRLHTDAIKNFIVPELKPSQITFAYANEADILNVALFGDTAGEWKTKNPDKDGNQRDHTTIHHLLVLANMESYNAEMIRQNIVASERIKKLNDMARYQLAALLQSNSSLLGGGEKNGH